MASSHSEVTHARPECTLTDATEICFEPESCGPENSGDEAVRLKPSSSSISSLSSVSSEHSDTSTIKYDQESWALYSKRVEKLCQILWPAEKTLKYRLCNSKFAIWLRATKLLHILVPSLQTPVIERLHGGDYNRIIGITLPSSDTEKGYQLILRVPREKDLAHPSRDVAVLNYVRQHSSIPVAKIAGQDFSCNNPLESPYVLQHRIPGEDLEKLWPNLTHAQRCTVATEMGRVMRHLLSMETLETGILEVVTDNAGSSTIVPFELKNALGEIIDEPITSASLHENSLHRRHFTLDFFNVQFNRWRAVDLERHAGEISHSVQLWDGMLKAVQEMDQLDLLKPTLKNCLCHVDLHPRNIMAEIQPDDTLKVRAILDWDEAVFAPKFVNCQPPLWLWDDDADERVDEEGLDPWPYELPNASGVPSSPEKAELKQIFEENAGAEYRRLAYEDVFRLSRGLFRLATLGLVSSENWRAAERILRDWEALRLALI